VRAQALNGLLAQGRCRGGRSRGKGTGQGLLRSPRYWAPSQKLVTAQKLRHRKPQETQAAEEVPYRAHALERTPMAGQGPLLRSEGQVRLSLYLPYSACSRILLRFQWVGSGKLV